MRGLTGVRVRGEAHVTIKNVSDSKWIRSLIPFLKQDKENDDEKINFLLLKKIGLTDLPGKFKISTTKIKTCAKTISLY